MGNHPSHPFIQKTPPVQPNHGCFLSGINPDSIGTMLDGGVERGMGLLISAGQHCYGLPVGTVSGYWKKSYKVVPQFVSVQLVYKYYN